MLLAYQMILMAALMPTPANGGELAEIHAYRVLDRPSFERGYREHLRWHAERNDRLAWFGWYVVSGSRKRAFVDGTFGAKAADLARRPDPDGDAADFKANVSRSVKAIGDEKWKLWSEVSRSKRLEYRRPVALMRVFVFSPKRARRFEHIVASLNLPGATWYRSTGQGQRYMLMTPAQTPREPMTLPGAFGGIPVRSEIWRYEPDLSLQSESNVG